MPEAQDTTRMVRRSSGPLPYTVGDTNFRGMDSRVEPERLDPGIAPLIQNYLSSGDGSLISRKGFQGCLTSAYANPVYALTRYVTSAGTVYFVWAASGKLYYSLKDATSGTEITLSGPTSFAFTNQGRGVMMRRHGKYLFLVDTENASGSLYRLDIPAIVSGGFAVDVSGYAPVATAPYATLREGGTLKGSLGAATWTAPSGVGTNLIPVGDTNFQGGFGGSFFWGEGGDPSAANTLDANATACVELDFNSAGSRDYVYTRVPVTLPAETSGMAGGDRVRLAVLAFSYAATENTGSTDPEQSVEVTVTGCDSTGAMIYETLQVFTTPTTRVFPERKFRGVIDMRNFADVQKLHLSLTAPEAVSTAGADVNLISLTVPSQLLSVGTSGSYATINQGSVVTENTTLFTKDCQARVAIGSTLDLSGLSTITADVIKEASVSALRIKMGIKSGSTWYYTDSGTAIDGGYRFSTANIKVALTSCTDFAFVFEADTTVNGLTSGGTAELFRVSTIRASGFLTTPASYTFWYTECIATGSTYDTVTFETTTGALGNTVDTDVNHLSAKVDLRGSTGGTLTFNSSTTHLAIWVLGASVPDGDTRARLAAFVPVGSNATLPASTTQDSVTNRYFWAYATREFYYNLADSDLYNADVYQVNRDRAPTGATSIAVHGGRLALGKSSIVYFSWLFDPDAPTAYPYFSNSSDPSDPLVDTKGALLKVSGTDDSNKVVALVPLLLSRGDLLGSALAAMMSDTPPSLITGWTGDITKDSAFQVRPFPQEVGGGCLSPKSVMEVMGGISYAAASGIVHATSESIGRKSLPIETEFSLASTSLARYGQVAAVLHDYRSWFMLPGAGSTDGTIYVLDERIEADKGWFKLVPPVGMTCGLSLSGNLDSGDLYFGGRDGQIYKYTGTADKATPASSNVAIATIVESRRHGQASAQGSGLYGVGRPYQVEMEASVGADTAFTVTLKNEYATSMGKTYNVLSGREKKTVIRGFSDVRGKVVSVRFAASSTSAITLRGYLVYLTEGGSLR